MAAINFPSSPSTGDVYTQNGQSWTYDGVKWVSGGTYAASGLTPRYQMGTFAPDIGFSGSNTDVVNFQNGQDNSFVIVARRSGRYTRNANLVTVAFDYAGSIDWNTVNGWAFKDRTLCFGLPYRANNPTGEDSNSFIIPTTTFRNYNTQLPTDSTTYCEGPLAAVNAGEDYCKFVQIRNGGSPDTTLTWDQWRLGRTSTNTFEVQIFISYWTSDTTWTPINGATVS